MRIVRKTFYLLIIVSLLASGIFAQGSYRQPPKEIMDVLNAPLPPLTSVSPAKDRVALLEPVRYPPIAELAEPMLRLAGLRINPRTNAPHRQLYFIKVVLKNISGGAETTVELPAGAKIVSPTWSADGKYIAAGNITPRGIELWIIDAASGKASKIENVLVNTTLGGFEWMPDQRSLIATLVPQDRGEAPSYTDVVPNEPNIQETAGKTGAVQTFQDTLKSPNDEKLFEYYTTSQIAVINIDGRIKNLGGPGIYNTFEPSPDGRFILTSRIKRPFSYLYPYSRFPADIEIWDADGKPVKTMANNTLQDDLPVQGVTREPRSFGWIPTEDATLMWAVALDEGDPRKKITPRDRLLKLAAPFSGEPEEVVKVEQRYSGRMFGENAGVMFFYDYNRDTQHRRIFMMDYRNPSEKPKLIADLNIRDRYNDIGQPVMKLLPNGGSVVLQKGDNIYLSGQGSTPQGDRPFLRRMNLTTGETNEIFRSGADEYETFVALLDTDGSRFITRREAETVPPNLFITHACPPQQKCQKVPDPVQLTDFQDPTPQLRRIKKQLVKYKRADGVDLSFTLYLPPDYQEGTRLPTVVWAYPLEYTSADVAGQVTGSTNRFTTISGYSHLFFLLQGYAVLDDATMPIVGDPLTVNDTFIKQLVMSAQAAVDKAVEMGVTDPERVGVGGHSYGAFMTANLLAHSDIFRAGIARSGAYNRTLTPFGFQSERRTFWEAKELYQTVSPFFFADKINEPILLIHGEADNNTGTYPMQSERLFAAIRGTGGTARLVMLPLESHGYAGRESIEHTVYEQLNWFDKYVKNAKPREKKQTAEN
jgi:dipeptidyl aminopeptidase/acylaminoacyl peptidase